MDLSYLPSPLITTTIILLSTLTSIYYYYYKNNNDALTSEYSEYPLLEKKIISPNTRIFRFGLANKKKALNLPIGKHIFIKNTIDGKDVIRPYTPISNSNTVGYFDLLIKVYEKGVLTSYIDKLAIGEKILAKGPQGLIEYKGNGIFQFGKNTSNIKVYRKIILIGGGTGITPLYQVIQAVLESNNDETELYLLFANVTEEDILMREDLENFAKLKKQFKLFFSLDKPTENWNGGKGYFSADMVEKNAPSANDDVLALLCGPPPMTRSVENILKGLGHKAENIKLF